MALPIIPVAAAALLCVVAVRVAASESGEIQIPPNIKIKFKGWFWRRE
jgi:hypothetical protein